jgi:hypothetical protein
MYVDHRCFDIAMLQEFLNRSNVIAAFKDVRGKGMSECVAFPYLSSGFELNSSLALPIVLQVH